MDENAQRIGTWVHRVRDQPTTLRHLVETVINDDPVTRCGRDLGTIKGTVRVYEADPPEHLRCSVCNR